MNDGTVVCLNKMAFKEFQELTNAILNHMIKDLSLITQLPEAQILEDYLYINDYDPIREVVKEQGKWDTELDKSLVLSVMERKLPHLKEEHQ